MTGREAIHAVCHMAIRERMAVRCRCYGDECRCADPTLARVASWSLDDASGWRALVTELRLVDCPKDQDVQPFERPKTLMERAQAAWMARSWSDRELADHLRTTKGVLGTYRRTVFKNCIWQVDRPVRYTTTFQMLEYRPKAEKKVA